jgi:hypothetical protein
LNIWQLENFYNSGDGYGGIIDMRNGDLLPDVTSIFDGTFHGGYGSRLGVDVFFAPFPIGYSDLLVLGGDIEGDTAILIDKLNTEPGGLNPFGIDVVLYDEGAFVGNPCDGPCRYGDAFYISPDSPDYISVGATGAIEDGLFAWFLFQDESGPGADFELRGLVGPKGVNTTNIIQGAVNIALETGRFVEDHIYALQFNGAGGGGADLATDYPVVADYAAPSSGGNRTGLWVKGTGSWIDADSSVTQMGIEFDTSFDQDIYSIFGGADMKPGGADSPWRIGLLGGYLTSTLDFDEGGTSVDYDGGSVGGYVAYNNGAFYADGTVKGDFLDTTYDLGSGSDVSADTTNISVMANTGYRMMMGRGFFEPILSLTYVHSETDDMTGGGGTVSFSNGESLQAGAGARVGTEFAMAGGTTQVSLLGKVWNEFEGDNTVTVTDMAMNSESFTTDFGGLFGEVSANATFTSANEKWSTFLQGGGKFGEDFTSWNAQTGVRLGF